MTTDIHAHYLAPEAVDTILNGAFLPDIRYRAENNSFDFPTSATRPIPQGMSDLDMRLKHMDSHGISLQILSTWVDMVGADLPSHTAKAYHRAVNEGLATAVERHPARFRFLASVPLPHAYLAAEELQYAVVQQGAVGAFIGTQVGEHALDDGAFHPFWAMAQELGVPVVLHPLSRPLLGHLKQYYLGNLLGNPFETTVAASRLIFGGVLDRFPKLQIVLLHGGGYLPYAVGRMNHGYRVRPESRAPEQAPSAYLDRFFYDHIVHDVEILRVLKQRVGIEHLLFGTDYPFDMEPLDPMGQANEALGEDAGRRMQTTAAEVFSNRPF